MIPTTLFLIKKKYQGCFKPQFYFLYLYLPTVFLALRSTTADFSSRNFLTLTLPQISRRFENGPHIRRAVRYICRTGRARRARELKEKRPAATTNVCPM